MHDRRIEGETYIFGNYGALWMNAMTWYDHTTGSVWTQPWGRALTGPLKGTQLKLLPFSLVPWRTWLAEHPDTLVLRPERNFSYGDSSPTDNFVIGVAIGDQARAYPYHELSSAIVVNDDLNGIPLVIHTNPETRSIHVLLRQLNDGTLLEFTGSATTLTDSQTGSTWDPVRGVATDGPLTGEGLREIPWITSYSGAWEDFYPDTDFYESDQ